LQVCYEEGRVGFACREEVVLHAKVEEGARALEPTTPTRDECSRFCDFCQAKEAAVEVAGLVLLAWGDGQLDMIEAGDVHGVLPTQVGWGLKEYYSDLTGRTGVRRKTCQV
jgi:hypothetical protein